MDNFDGQIMFALIAALLLAWGASQLIARLYANKVLQFMQAKSATMAVSAAIDTHHRQHPIATDLSLQNRHAVWRLRAALILITVTMGAMMAYVAQAAYVVDGFSWRRLMVLTVVYAWSSVPAIGLLERWSRLKILLASVSYVALSGILVILNSKETPDLGAVFTWLFFEQLPLLIFVFVMTGRKLRSVGPYLLLVFFPLTTSSLVGLSVLDTAINKGPDTWVIDLVMMTNSYVVFALFGIFPWLIAFYPIRFFADRIALAYRCKAFSEPLYLLAGLWSIALLVQAMALSHSVGFNAYGLLAAWLLIPLSALTMKPLLQPRHQPPTVLFLRVFRGDDDIENLFDSVIEKWRYSGNTLMIAGKDLALRNLEPDELFAFLSGRLQDRFISDESRLKTAIGELDMQADPDGRYRVNEFFCFDSTWKAVLSALVDKADCVLMDLRGYNSQREGCTHELTVLATSPHLQKLVILFNRQTEKPTVAQLLSPSTTNILWIDSEAHNPKELEQKCLAALLVP